jgi:hypothetical protein
MGSPGFAAQVSLYRTTLSYLGLATSSGRSTGRIAAGDLAPTFGRGFDVAYFKSVLPFNNWCGAPGQRCCLAPFQNLPAFGPLVSCQRGLGCDVTTNKCVSPCGGSGQVCCDGPETRALKWTAEGNVYSPTSWNLREMCDTGACDIQAHRCYTCGTQDGGPCCPPDASQATARCVGDSLECQFDPGGFAVSGTCRACGSKGRLPCRWGCEPGLDIRNGRCDICGGDSQPPCDRGCNSGLGLAQGLCRQCGNAQQIRCDSGCKGGLKVKNGLCAACGDPGQAPCDSGCNSGTRLINGACTRCGYNGQPACNNGCVPPTRVAGGICRYCGANGQVACDTGCNQGLVLQNGFCAAPQMPPPPTPPPELCSDIGGPCVPDRQPGTHCCQRPGSPELCVFETCKACIPHGQECVRGGTQICCSAKDGDVCVLDQFTEKVVCGIPDAPGTPGR